MLGYEVDFGHMEVVGLISSSKYAEKQVARPELDDESPFLLNCRRLCTADSVDLFACLSRVVASSARRPARCKRCPVQCLLFMLVCCIANRKSTD